MFKEIKEDLIALKSIYNIPYIVTILSNRGWHSLFVYRISHFFWRIKIPMISMILTRIIQILYSIDIDFKCKIYGGVIIIHGVGLVIGKGVEIKKGTIIYHQVTLGEKGSGIKDGYPKIGNNVILGSGAKLFGDISVGNNSIVGPNVVLTQNLEANKLLKFKFSSFEINNK